LGKQNGFPEKHRSPLNRGGFCVISLLSKRGAEGQSRTDTGSPPPVFECGALCTNQFHHETYSIIGSLVVLAGMVRPIKSVGQTS